MNVNLILRIVYFIIVILISISTLAQDKRQLTQQDYKSWNTLKMGESSEDGLWTSYTKSHQNGIDTLFLMNTKTNYIYTFQSGYNEKITPNGEFFSYMKSDTLHILTLKNNNIVKYPNIQKFVLTKNGKYLIYLSNYKEKNTLSIKYLDSDSTSIFTDVSEFNINPTESDIVMIQNKNKVLSVELDSNLLKKEQSVIIQKEDWEFQRLTWSENGISIAFFAFDKWESKNEVIFVHSIKNYSSIFHLESNKAQEVSDGSLIVPNKLFISDDGNKVFFDLSNLIEKVNISSSIQIWKTSDNQIPPSESTRNTLWSVWLPFSQSVKVIENNNLTACALTDNQQKVILFDNNRYLPKYKYGDSYSDVYIMDLNTGNIVKILEKQLSINNHLVTSLKGHNIAYFKDKNWWLYNIKTGIHSCYSDKLKTIFNKSRSDRLDSHHSYGFGGWTDNDEIIVYDEFDIWLLSENRSKNKRLTNGFSTRVRHRLNTNLSSTIRYGFFGHLSNSFNLKNELIIKTLDTKKLSEGFGTYTLKSGFKEVVHKDCKIVYIKKIPKRNTFQYIESTFDSSPKIVNITLNKSPKLIAQGNLQQKKFHWGKSQLIHFSSPNGEELKGALFFPANYDTKKKYPMIVYIYENKSYALHEYVAPSLESFDGVNITNFTTEGYFVLLPDISYSINKPGLSALNCVNSAMDEAIKTGSIDENSIGLIGHSFGGFETTYIISQTDRFKTAIAGAGVTDLLSFYLDIDSSNKSNIERFENEQFRNKIPFTDKEFIQESPIMNVKTINTPLLLWTGDKDQLVSPTYSIKMFAALWRLGKESTLLIYPNEQHVLVNSKNQIDLSSKIISWLNHHLKNSPKDNWINY